MLIKLQKRYKQILILILLVSVTLRILASLYIGNEVVSLPGTFDQISYHNLALRVLDGHGFSFGQEWWPITSADEPTAHWSYLYTLYLVAVYAISGSQPIIARLIQSILVGILQPLFIYLIGRHLFGTVAGLLAAALSAVYIYFFYYAATLMTEPFYITAILASLYFSIRLVKTSANKPSPRFFEHYRYAIALGFTLGLTVLLRQLFLLLIPFIILWLWWAGKQQAHKSLLTEILIIGGLVVAMILPFTIFNYARFDRFVLLNTNAGFAFYWANHPIYGIHYLPLLPVEMGSYVDLIPEELRILDEAALDQALLKLGLQIVIEDPVRYVRLSLSRIPIYFMFWPSSDSGTLSNISRLASFGLMWPFMLYGWLLAIYKAIYLSQAASLRHRTLDFLATPTCLLSLFILIYAGIHLLSWSLIRYRLPIDAVWLIFAAYGILDLGQRIYMRSNQNDTATEFNL
jgi:hypothetical protein